MKTRKPKYWKCYQDDDRGYQTYKHCDLAPDDGRWYCNYCTYGVAPLEEDVTGEWRELYYGNFKGDWTKIDDKKDTK